jgi:hypothetical protein
MGLTTIGDQRVCKVVDLGDVIGNQVGHAVFRRSEGDSTRDQLLQRACRIGLWHESHAIRLSVPHDDRDATRRVSPRLSAWTASSSKRYTAIEEMLALYDEHRPE